LFIWRADSLIFLSQAAGDHFCIMTILPHLEELRFAEVICQLLQGDAESRSPEFRCQQIAFVKDVGNLRYNIPVALNALARALEDPRSRVQSALVHGLNELGHRAEPAAIDRNREHPIFDWIRRNAE
jgi:hypothetical protein